MGQEKWTITNHTKGQSSSKEGDVVYMDWKGVLYYALLLENQTINSNKYWSPLDQMKAALIEKCLELVNRKRIIFHQDNARPHVSFWWPGKNYYSLAGKFWFIHHIHQTLHLWISIYLGLYKILLMEKISTPWNTVKGTWNSSLLKKFWGSFPGGAVVEESACQCRGHGSSPGPGRYRMPQSN